ncbi:MAG: Fe-S protein assembly co-chaperone HscB [Bacteroidota bacterium]|nr:Fe-S protein assembly co-chaperone HscB [Bacteroidota bacterium]MDP4234668.1 Fe-S protein assembly co-chaperone HscB [Bacteroidota bacterium]MDP4243833.1 Fe-S protein assembly co-chaperone HscB [Bacteroidota bacterium]MDP4288576.1 Fe-S protein assembly co-chaperone HscB [Bacteroidota bacterium]
MTDHFQIFGIDRTFAVNREMLEARFHELQSRSHPDRHVQSEVETRDRALSESSEINAAYRTLREQLPRARHLVELYGFPVGEQKNVPPALLMTVMDAQEKIMEREQATSRDAKMRNREELEAIADELQMRREALDEERHNLANHWDRNLHEQNGGPLSNADQELLGRMSQLLAERAYLETLHWSVQAAQQGKPAFIQH